MSAVEQWLARETVRAEHLLSIAHGDLEAARSSMAASAAGAWLANGVTWSIESGKVAYRHPVHGEGVVPVRVLVKLAAAEATEEKSARLRSTYGRYVETSIEGQRYPLWPKPGPERIAEHEKWFGRYCQASRALDEARRDWWSPAVASYAQIDMFEEIA